MTFSDWFDYQKLRIKSMFGLLPPPPKGRHVHQCPKCGKLWMHEAGANDIAAHTCPREGCGGVQFWPVGSSQDGCAKFVPRISDEDVKRWKSGKGVDPNRQ